MKIGRILFGSIIIIIFLSVISFAQDNSRMKRNKIMKNDNMIQSNKMGVAINSYDPVAYFTDGKAEKGNSMYSYKWMGAEWYFISESDMKMFKENPNKYTPAYGGNCAYAVGKGALVSGEPRRAFGRIPGLSAG